jgi:hypothetical protein
MRGRTVDYSTGFCSPSEPNDERLCVPTDEPCSKPSAGTNARWISEKRRKPIRRLCPSCQCRRKHESESSSILTMSIGTQNSANRDWYIDSSCNTKSMSQSIRVLNTVEAESVPATFSLVSSHGLNRGSLPLRPKLPTTVHSTYERLTRRLDLLLYSTGGQCSVLGGGGWTSRVGGPIGGVDPVRVGSQLQVHVDV